MFDGFDVHAAAEGLFHPASEIAAFIEHDAKYNASKGVQNASKPGGPKEDPSFLPVLSDRSSQQLDRSSSFSSNASSGSSRRHLDSRSSLRTSSAAVSTRSDSDLHAPRRYGAIPSSADRSAIDFYEHDESDDDCDELNMADAKNTSAVDDHRTSSVVGTFDLTAKFDALKLMLNSNQVARTSGRPEESAIDHNAPTTSTGMAKAVEPSGGAVATKTTVKTRDTAKLNDVGRSTRASSIKAPAGGGVKTKTMPVKREGKPSTVRHPVARASHDEPAGEPADGEPIAKAGKKKEVKGRNGMSLSDLKEEHRAALELLKELGGPASTDYRDEDMENSIKALAARSTKHSAVRSSIHTTVHQMPAKALAGHAHVDPPRIAELTSHALDQREGFAEQLTRPTSTSSTASLVGRLRSSIALGRETADDNIVRDNGADDDEKADDDDGDDDSQPKDEARIALTRDGSVDPDAKGGNDEEDEKQGSGEVKQVVVTKEDQWKQYNGGFDSDGDDDDEQDDDEDDGEDDSGDYGEHVPVTSRSAGNRYSDDGFEAEW